MTRSPARSTKWRCRSARIVPPVATEGGVSVIVRSGDYESAHYALALASAALAVNKPAVLFFTMNGIRALTKPPGLTDWGRDAIYRERGVGDFETLLQACVEL